MSNDQIKCLDCGALTHSIKVHIKRDHSAAAGYCMTLEEYMRKYPSTPVLSEVALRKIEEQKAAAKDKTPVAAAATASKVMLSELFGLEPSQVGKDFAVSICQQTGHEGLIPDYKAAYVYNVDILKTIVMAFEENKSFYIYGHGGLGKTSIITQVCAKTQRRRVRMQHTVNLEEADIKGRWVVEKEVVDGQALSVMKFKLGPLALAMIHGWVYLADEYDRAPPSVLSVYQAVLERDGALHIPEAPEEYQFIRPHPDFRFCATGNTNGSGDDSGLYSATIIQDTATMDRLSPIIKVDYMPEEQEVAMLRSSVPIKQADAKRLVSLAARTREMFPQRISLPYSPRSLIDTAQIGLMRGSYLKGVELCYANRLPADERRAILEMAQREFGSAA